MHVMTTDNDLGRRSGACADEHARLGDALRKARKVFAALSDDLERELDSLQFRKRSEEDESRLAIVNDLVKRNQTAIQTVLNVEAKLARESERFRPQGAVIDLERAREEIIGRLARLAA